LTLPDVNVLLYAFRRDSDLHKQHAAWLSSVVNGKSAFGMSPQVLSSVVRIATNPRIFVRPNRAADVIAFADTLLDQPHCRIVQPGARHWMIFRNLCKEANATGNLVQDAWLAALAIEHGCEWITTDSDYAKFPGLRWRSIVKDEVS
jgi:toxin-antitoxin system PIN domain toxin